MNEGLRTATAGPDRPRAAAQLPLRRARLPGLRRRHARFGALANGVYLMGRSFKYHRPRGPLAAGAEEPNALVTVRRDGARETPNLRATQVELYEGLEAFSQNRWPALAFDVGAVNDLLAPFIPAGFYYKTFMWPRRAWHALYEPRIRAAAGLGRAPGQADPDRYATRYAHCDVLVVGAGLAGLSAAAAAAGGGGAGHPLRRAGRARRLAARKHPRGVRRRDARRRMARREACVPRRERARHAPAAHHGVRLLSAQSARPQRAPHRAPRRPGRASAARAAVAGARARGGARHRRDRAPARLPRQRPPRDRARGCGAHLAQSLRRRARHARGAGHRLRRGLSGGPRARARGSLHRPDRRHARRERGE